MTTKHFELTHPQKRVWYTQALIEQTQMWNCGGLLKINRLLDLDLLEKAINVLIEKHAGMRLRFNKVEGEIKQHVADYEYENFIRQYFYNENDLLHWAEKNFQEGFVNLNSKLYDVSIINLNDEYTYCYFKYHHIIADGWCCNIFARQISKTYNELIERENIGEEPEYTYLDYIEYEKEYLLSNRFDKDHAYWIERFNEIPEQIYQFKLNDSCKAKRYAYAVPPNVSSKIKELCQETKISYNTFFLGALLVYIYKAHLAKKFTVGVPVLNRVGAIEKQIVGMCASTLPFSYDIDDSMNIIELFKHIDRRMLRDFAHQRYPYDLLAVDLQLAQKKIDNLYQVIFTYLNYSIDDIVIHNASMEFIELFAGYQSVPLSIKVNEWFNDGSITIVIDYNAIMFSKEDIQLMCGRFSTIIEQFLKQIKNPEFKIADLSLLNRDEKEQILYDFNNTKVEYPKDRTIHELFEEQVERTPDNVAVAFGDQQLTYRELNQKANQLAAVLREKGVRADTIVGIMLERSIDMMVGIFGIVKAGGAYLPIDPKYPMKRIEYMLEDSRASILITSEEVVSFGFSGTVLNIKNSGFFKGDGRNLEKVTTSRDLAYVIYTSGSTGEPKGAMIEHHALVNRLTWMQKKYPLDTNDVILQKTTFTFDVSVWELFWWSIYGASVFLLGPEEEKEPGKILDNLRKQDVTVMHFVPSMFSAFLHYIEEKGINTDGLRLKQIFTSGEALQVDQVQSFFRLFKNVALANLYGPTEATIDVSYYDCVRKPYGSSIPIGKPIDNIYLYVIGENSGLQPIGVPGELCIGGVGLARGYLNKPELTDKKFVENPFCPDEKMYRTGDLARWMPDGNIEFLGRIDHQVKIRGYRIELGEIEKKLLEYEDIDSAVVLVKEDKEGSKYLCAYVVSKNKLVTQELREYLLNQVPEYMVPQLFFQIESIPLSNNGKINTKALFEIKELIPTGNEYIPPQNKIQEKMAEVWAKVLNVKSVGIHDNYFELGGDSIKAIKIIYELEREGLALTIEDIIKFKTIDKLSEKVEYYKLNIPQDLVVGEVKLSPIQKMFFNEENIKYMNHFNQSIMVYYKDGLKEEYIRQAFVEIINHHDALRTICEVYNDQLKQHVLPIVDSNFIDLKTFYFHDEEGLDKLIENECNKIQASIDLNNGPLVKLGLFKTKEGDHLLIVINHLIIDNVSWRIILEDFNNLYKAEITNSKYEMPSKTHSYKVWVNRLYEYAENEIHTDEKEHWYTICNIPIKPLRVDNNISKRENMDSKNLIFSLSEGETVRINNLVAKGYAKGVDVVLLLAFANAINEWNKSSKTMIAYESHGRNHMFKDINITRTVGWFTSVYPVILEHNDILSLDSLQSLERVLGNTPNSGHGYSCLKYLTEQLESCNTEPEVAFNYIGDIHSVDYEGFQLSKSPKGTEVGAETLPTFKLFISGSLENGRIQINLIFNGKEYNIKTIEMLAELFKKSISSIIESQYKSNTKTEESKEKTYIQLENSNKTNKTKVMLFPPHMIRIAYESIYRKLVTYMEDYDVYMFTMQNSKHIVSDYVDDIINIQKEEPYILMGYSAGGNLAFHVALELEKRGKVVSDIIMLDAPRWEKGTLRELEQETMVSELLSIIEKYNEGSAVDLSSDTIKRYLQKENVIKEMVYYNEYYKHYNASGNSHERTHANIHMLFGDFVIQNYYINDTRFSWTDNTEGTFYTYRVEGDHFTIFSKTNISKNAEAICNILESIIKDMPNNHAIGATSNKKI